MRAEARGGCASGACCCYPSGWQAAQGVQPASLAAATDSFWTSPSGMKRMRTQSVLWYLGTPGTTATRSAPWCGVAFGRGRRLAPGLAGRRGVARLRRRRPRRARLRARRAGRGSLGGRSPGPAGAGPGNAMMSASDSRRRPRFTFAGSASEPSAASVRLRRPESARRRSPRRRLRHRRPCQPRRPRRSASAAVPAGTGDLPSGCGAGDRGRDGLGRLAALVRVSSSQE